MSRLPGATKERVNVSIDRELMVAVRANRLNVSQICESALKSHFRKMTMESHKMMRVMDELDEGAEKRRKAELKAAGRNDPCPCGSGKKYKHCCISNKA